jgi:rod shape-determining protein MreD
VRAADVAKASLLLWLAVLLQATLLSRLGPGAPDLVLVAVVLVALLRGSVFGAFAGFAAGLLLDVTVDSTVLGVTSLLLATTGYWIGRYGETSGRDRGHAPYLSVAVVTVLVAFGSLALRFVLQQPVSAQRDLFYGLPTRFIFDVLLTAPLFACARRMLRRPTTRERGTEVRLLA